MHRRLDALADTQDEAIVHLREAGIAFDEAVSGMRQALDAMHAANLAHDAVFVKVLEANREAKQILRTLSH